MFLCVLCVLGVVAVNSAQVSGGEIDRLIATVNGRVITEGDLVLARSLNAILSFDTVAKSESRESEINRLVDLELMRQELKNFSMLEEDEGRVEARMNALRQAYSEKGGLSSLLCNLGLQESELIAYLRLESSILEFVDFRFRPFVNVSEDEIKNYYDSRLAPQLRNSGLDLPPLVQVSEKIKEVLREEEINAVLEQWIKDVRRNSRIEYYDSNGPEK